MNPQDIKTKEDYVRYLEDKIEKQEQQIKSLMEQVNKLFALLANKK